MQTELIEPVADLLAILVYAAVSAVLTYEGLLSELSAIGTLGGSGELGLGLWYLFVGTLAIYAGLLMVGRDLFWERLRARLG